MELSCQRRLAYRRRFLAVVAPALVAVLAALSPAASSPAAAHGAPTRQPRPAEALDGTFDSSSVSSSVGGPGQDSAAAKAACAESSGTSGDGLAIRDAVFKSTHNSYSGNHAPHHRGTIIEQLCAKVRFLEFDIWNTDYSLYKDFRIGHGQPGQDVYDEGGNPATFLLTPWLRQIRTWSDQHPQHAPITLLLDLKNDFSTATTAADGSLATLNHELTSVFQQSLRWAQGREGNPGTVGDLRGKILVVLSGDHTSRVAYRRDTGVSPAVSINTSGQVVEVSGDGRSGLWYWSGQVDPTTHMIAWKAHGRYDSGVTPAVALRPDGVLVEVHKSEHFESLYYHVAKIGGNGDITWGSSHFYQSGALDPAIRLYPYGTNKLLEIHRHSKSTQNYARVFTVNPVDRTITGMTDESPTREHISKGISTAAGQPEVRVYTQGNDQFPASTLRYTLRGPDGAGFIRYQQVAYVEQQPGDTGRDLAYQYFYAAPASNKAALREAHAALQATRAWGFRSPADDAHPWYVDFPATDDPGTRDYQNYLTSTRAWVW